MGNQNLPGGRAYYTGKNAYASQAFELDTRRQIQEIQNQLLILRDALALFTPLNAIAGLSIIGNATNATGVPTVITGINGQILRVSGTTLGFGNILTNFITGTTTNDNAPSGDIGEFQSVSVADNSVTSWSSANPKNITSITLGGGDYLVSYEAMFGNGAITGTNTLFGISTNTGSFTGGSAFFETPSVPGGSGSNVRGTGTTRISLAGSTTIYLVGRITFSGGTPQAGGTIRAWRVR